MWPRLEIWHMSHVARVLMQSACCRSLLFFKIKSTMVDAFVIQSTSEKYHIQPFSGSPCLWFHNHFHFNGRKMHRQMNGDLWMQVHKYGANSVICLVCRMGVRVFRLLISFRFVWCSCISRANGCQIQVVKSIMKWLKFMTLLSIYLHKVQCFLDGIEEKTRYPILCWINLYLALRCRKSISLVNQKKHIKISI